MAKRPPAPLEDGRPAYVLGPKLLAWRLEHGLSVEELADAWGISRAEMLCIESRRMPSPAPAATRYRALVGLMLRVEACGGEPDSASTAQRLHALHVDHDTDKRVHDALDKAHFARLKAPLEDERR